MSQFIVSLAILAMAQSPAADSSATYKIGPGDLLAITVFGEEDLSLKQIRVNNSGMISLPLIGEIKITGLSSREAEKLIEGFLIDGYLKSPKVTVSILQYRMFYVHGEVRNPGGYQYVEGLTVEKAIALAGGFTPRASESRIRLVKDKSQDEEPEKVDMNTAILPGDIIMVGESIF